MNIRFDRAQLHLEARELIRLYDPRGARVECVRGALWITQNRDHEDYFLAANDALPFVDLGAFAANQAKTFGLEFTYEFGDGRSCDFVISCRTTLAVYTLAREPEPLPEDSLKREGLDLSHRLIGMSVREPGVAAPDIDQRHYHALLANAADYMVDRFDADLVFVPMERKVQDTQHSHAVVSQMSHAPRATVLKGEYTSGQMLSLVHHFAFAVGMRLHFLIFAALSRVPFVALPYSSKVMGFLEDLEIESPPLTEVNAGRLIAHIDRSWDLRGMLQARLDRGVPGLQERARRTNEIAVDLLGKRRQGAPGSSAAGEPSG